VVALAGRVVPKHARRLDTEITDADDIRIAVRHLEVESRCGVDDVGTRQRLPRGDTPDAVIAAVAARDVRRTLVIIESACGDRQSVKQA